MNRVVALNGVEPRHLWRGIGGNVRQTINQGGAEVSKKQGKLGPVKSCELSMSCDRAYFELLKKCLKLNV